MAEKSVPANLNPPALNPATMAVHQTMAGQDRSALHDSDLPIKKRVQPMDQKAEVIPRLSCELCRRSFASPRSLSIHKGHHVRQGRARMRAAAAAGIPGVGSVNGQRRVFVQRRPSNGPDVVHECLRCRRNFISGQALGAHKRYCTWVPIKKDTVKNFDLNELPPPGEEDSLVSR